MILEKRKYSCSYSYSCSCVDWAQRVHASVDLYGSCDWDGMVEKVGLRLAGASGFSLVELYSC